MDKLTWQAGEIWSNHSCFCGCLRW